ncbi:hypothetical protein G6F23_015121 [Rhizopus arrhizus]|nr:hypothetical protein G6F23_015121 [Rhizopus arrhizus]
MPRYFSRGPRGVVIDRAAGHGRSSRVGVVAAGDRGQHGRGIGDAACHRPGGVLAERDRDDAVAAAQSHRRLPAAHAGGRRRAAAAAGVGIAVGRAPRIDGDLAQIGRGHV